MKYNSKGLLALLVADLAGGYIGYRMGGARNAVLGATVGFLVASVLYQVAAPAEWKPMVSEATP